MTNEEMLEDLKSFMTATVRTEVNVALDAKLEEKLAPIHQRLDSLEAKVDDLTEFVQDAITTSNDVNQEQLDNHEVRITKLETATV